MIKVPSALPNCAGRYMYMYLYFRDQKMLLHFHVFSKITLLKAHARNAGKTKNESSTCYWTECTKVLHNEALFPITSRTRFAWWGSFASGQVYLLVSFDILVHHSVILFITYGFQARMTVKSVRKEEEERLAQWLMVQVRPKPSTLNLEDSEGPLQC